MLKAWHQLTQLQFPEYIYNSHARQLGHTLMKIIKDTVQGLDPPGAPFTNMD